MDIVSTNKPDDLQLYFGDDYKINDNLIIHQPLMDDVIRLGEQKYFGLAQTVTAIPSDMKSQLFDIGVDYMEMQDISLFFMLLKGMDKSLYQLFFPTLDFNDLELYQHEDGRLIISNADGSIIITEYIYVLIQDFLCRIHGFKKKKEFAGNKRTKQILIDDDRARIKEAKGKPFSSILIPQVSSLVNCPYFKYKIEDIRHMTLYQFTDCVQRVMLFDSVFHLADGYYSGNLDTSKFDTSKLNWIRDLKES